MYIHEFKDWPRFHWHTEELAEALASVRHRQGRLIGHMEALGFNLRQEAVLQTLTADVVKTSEIEGETYVRTPVRLARLVVSDRAQWDEENQSRGLAR